MSEQTFMRVDDVAKELGVSASESEVSQKANESHPIPAPRGGDGSRRRLLRF